MTALHVVFEPRNNESTLEADLRAAQYADDALAQKFTALHGDNWRYTAVTGRWSRWSDFVWKQDETLAVCDLVRAVCRSESTACQDDPLKRRIASAQTVSAVERLARADRCWQCSDH